MGMMEQEAWHPERSINISALPEHFLHLCICWSQFTWSACRLHGICIVIANCAVCASGHPHREISNCIDSPAGHGGGAWWYGGGALQMRQCHGGWELVCGYAGTWARAQLWHMWEMRSWGQRSRWCRDSVPEGSSAGLIQSTRPWRMTNDNDMQASSVISICISMFIWADMTAEMQLCLTSFDATY
jgi:hypothetical protein